MFLGIITYLDTVKGFNLDYSAISEQKKTQEKKTQRDRHQIA